MAHDRDDDQSTEGGKNNETTYEVHRAEGDVLFKQRVYAKACQSYTHALDLMQNKDDKEGGGGGGGGGKPKAAADLSKEEEKLQKDMKDILVARSKCHLMIGNATAALEDAETALKEDKIFIKALYQKAEALYLQGDFENALVCYHRGNSQRPELSEFKQGINKSTEAINNSIGTADSVKLEKKGLEHFYSKQDEEEHEEIKSSSSFSNVSDDEEERNKKKAKAGKTYGKPGKQDNKPKEKQRPKVLKDTKTIKELLGDLYQDREYLDKLLREEEAMEQKTQSSQKIQDLCIEGINYLDSRTDFWRQQKPMYARKRDKQLQKQQQERGKRGSQSMRYIVKNIEEIDDSQANGDYEKSIKQSKKTLRLAEQMDDENEDKPEILASLYSYMGNGYLETCKYDLALEYHNKDLEQGEKYDMEESKSRSLDNLGRVYARMERYQEAVDVWEKKLPMSKSDLEKTWLYHEIGRCYLELDEFDKAHDYGEKSQEAAKTADDDVWQLNASVLIAQAEVRQGDYNSAVSSFERALDMARVQGDKPAEDAIKRALDEVNKKIAQAIRDDEMGSDEKAQSDGDTKDEVKSDNDDAVDDKNKPKIDEATYDMGSTVKGDGGFAPGSHKKQDIPDSFIKSSASESSAVDGESGSESDRSTKTTKSKTSKESSHSVKSFVSESDTANSSSKESDNQKQGKLKERARKKTKPKTPIRELSNVSVESDGVDRNRTSTRKDTDNLSDKNSSKKSTSSKKSLSSISTKSDKKISAKQDSKGSQSRSGSGASLKSLDNKQRKSASSLTSRTSSEKQETGSHKSLKGLPPISLKESKSSIKSSAENTQDGQGGKAEVKSNTVSEDDVDVKTSNSKPSNQNPSVEELDNANLTNNSISPLPKISAESDGLKIVDPPKSKANTEDDDDDSLIVPSRDPGRPLSPLPPHGEDKSLAPDRFSIQEDKKKDEKETKEEEIKDEVDNKEEVKNTDEVENKDEVETKNEASEEAQSKSSDTSPRSRSNSLTNESTSDDKSVKSEHHPDDNKNNEN